MRSGTPRASSADRKGGIDAPFVLTDTRVPVPFQRVVKTTFASSNPLSPAKQSGFFPDTYAAARVMSSTQALPSRNPSAGHRRSDFLVFCKRIRPNGALL